MKNSEKKVYVAPSMEVLVVELEQGIAAGSGATAGATPESNDWGTGTGGTVNGDAF